MLCIPSLVDASGPLPAPLPGVTPGTGTFSVTCCLCCSALPLHLGLAGFSLMLLFQAAPSFYFVMIDIVFCSLSVD